MNEFTVPSWNLSHQRRQEVAGEEGNRSSSHVHNQPHHSYVVPMSNNEVAELIWENGQLAMHGLTPILQAPASAPEKAPTYGIASDTLESVVHHATCYKHNEENSKQLQETTNQAHVNPTAAATSGRKRPENVAGNVQMAPAGIGKKKRRSSESDQCGTYNFSNSRLRSLHEDQAGGAAERGACASASATFCREKDTTMMTWASFESPGSLKTRTTDEDSASQDGSENRDEDQLETKGETVRSHSARRSRAAIIHNQSERRRRDRINQKIKALQKLVPNASKTDKASMLDEVIEYLKQLQAQVHMMSTRNMPHQMMMNPLAMQQQLQMSLLARTGMGVGLVGTGMGMLDMNNLARSSSRSLQPGLVAMTPLASATPTFVPPHFVLPAAAVPTCNPFHTKSPVEASTNTPSAAFADPYTAFLSQQSMNMDFYKKMAALHRQEAKQATQTTSHPSQANFI